MVITMKIIDLTHTISEDMPVYPGTERPTLTAANTIEKDGFRETVLHMFSHTGTHTDSPAHLFRNGKSLDRFDASHFYGRAVMLDCRSFGENARVTKDMLLSLGEKFEKADFLILRTGYEEHWKDERYFSGYPCIDRDTAEYIARCGKKGIGVDAISVDPVGVPLDVHKILLGTDDFIIVENLCNLGLVGCDEFEFAAYPLKVEDSDGAPTRAVAIIR